jgi:hypothetical protein
MVDISATDFYVAETCSCYGFTTIKVVYRRIVSLLHIIESHRRCDTLPQSVHVTHVGDANMFNMKAPSPPGTKSENTQNTVGYGLQNTIKKARLCKRVFKVCSSVWQRARVNHVSMANTYTPRLLQATGQRIKCII